MSKPNFAFNQFESALTGFVNNFQLKLQQMIPDLPVYIQATGDFSYMVNKKFLETKNQEIYQKIPRVVIKIEDIQINQQEDSNQYNKFYYIFDNEYYQCTARRKAYTINITSNFVCSNFITMLNNMEVIAVLCAKDNVFTYEFLGNTFQSAYVNSGTNSEIPSIDMGSGGTRNCTFTNQWELQVHLIVPVIDSIVHVDDSVIDRIDFDLRLENDYPKHPKIKVDSELTEIKNRMIIGSKTAKDSEQLTNEHEKIEKQSNPDYESFDINQDFTDNASIYRVNKENKLKKHGFE